MTRHRHSGIALALLALVFSVSCAESHPAGEAGVDGLDGGATCTVRGEYWLPSSAIGFMAYFQFREDGTWTSALDPAELDTASAWGTYTSEGSTFTMTGAPCRDTSSVGRYTVTFGPACDEFTIESSSEPCPDRAGFDGVTFTRL